jgi:fructosamine-3-kinase
MTAPLPAPVRAGVLRVLAEGGGSDARIEAVAAVGGGSINRAARLTLTDGRQAFVKWNPDAPANMFPTEADGLRALGASAALRVPEVLGVSGDWESPRWLLLEYLPETAPNPGYAEALGRGLAALHRSSKGGWGWPLDNYIGSLPQANQPAPTWAAFWRDRRLDPQVRRAVHLGLLESREAALLESVLGGLDALLQGADDDSPSLLHGDLWSGNAYAGPGGDPVIIDPAVYRGHREVDLAMSELFGGFPARFYDAYGEAWPVSAGYRERRRDCYQLYYLLVHVNLFGRGYVPGTLEKTRRLVG